MSDDNALIAQIGRTIGLWGDLKFNLHTDFPEQFKVGQTYVTARGELTIADINEKRGIIRFRGYESIDSAKKLTNTKIYANETQTRENCQLGKREFFWFDIIGCTIHEADIVLGIITEVQRMGDTDYLVIDTDEALVTQGYTKTFLIPYIERYVTDVTIEEKRVFVKDAKEILEAS